MTACLCCNSDAGHRYACTRCTTTMRRWLRELEDYAIIIALTTAPLRAPTNGSMGGAYGSKAPARDNALTILDNRSRVLPPRHYKTNWDAKLTEDGLDPAGLTEDWLDPHVDEANPTRSLPGSIHGIACWIREEHEESEPERWTLASELRYLIGKIETCVHAQWIAELYDDIHELHTQARNVANDSPPGTLGNCLSCGADVYPADVKRGDKSDRHAKCSNRDCRREYSGLDYVRLQAAQDAS